MYSILIVDDEAIERNGIKFLIKKYNFGLNISEAGNGKDALKYLKNNKIDILFTDVKMPFMDGLELSREARALYPKLIIIIFSGYGEFEYAKTAISLEVSDYILKPIDVNEFQHTIQKVITEIDIHRQEEKKNNFSLKYEKQYILFNLINGTPPETLMSELKLFSNIDFIEDYKRMFLLEFNQPFFEKFYGTFFESLNYIVNDDFDYVNFNSYQSVLLYHGTKRLDFLNTAQKIYDLIYKKYGTHCYIALSHSLCGSKNIADEFSLLEQCLENKFFILNSYIFSLDGASTHTTSNSEIDKELMNCITYDIEVKDCNNLKNHIETLCETHKKNNNYSYLYVMFIFSNLLKEIYKAIPKYNEADLSQGVEKIYKSNNFDNIKEILIEAVNNLENSQPELEFSHREIELVKKYIYEHFDSSLSLKELADYTYLTPNYLSYIFKKETGSGLNKFIKSHRMERAKYLLENTSMKIFNISQSIGYTNVSYFCQSFREYYGVSPDKYRQKEEGGTV